MTTKVINRLICRDARSLDKFIAFEEQQPRTVITSPPYLDTQDYGVPGQIGFGQIQEKYFEDLQQIFEKCLNISADDSTMWLVVGAIRRNGQLIQLPELLTSLASEVGWIPREQITWAKEKALPWTKSGEFRDVTEQVILLSKSDSFMFDVGDLLSPIPRSPWWKRYPERYSPKGRRPTNLWNIQIPTQGSWKDGPGHLCPFPHELTYRMITLTSEPGDVVLDPFAGIGSVPAMAEAMGRIGYGLELSQQYVNKYWETRKRAHEWYSHKKLEIENSWFRKKVFYDTIIELRLLKFGKLIGNHLARDGYPVEWIHVIRSQLQADEKYKIVVGYYEVKVPELIHKGAIVEFLEEVSCTPPLSKFGVQPVFHVSDQERSTLPQYWYREGNYWSEPVLMKPKGPELHLSSDFRPCIEDVSEMTIDTVGTALDCTDSELQVEELQATLFDTNSY